MDLPLAHQHDRVGVMFGDTRGDIWVTCAFRHQVLIGMLGLVGGLLGAGCVLFNMHVCRLRSRYGCTGPRENLHCDGGAAEGIWGQPI